MANSTKSITLNMQYNFSTNVSEKKEKFKCRRNFAQKDEHRMLVKLIQALKKVIKQS